MTIFDQLKRDEGGYRQKPYLDCCGKYWRDCTCAVKGKLTIGVGRNLDDVGISDAESNYLEGNDVAKVTSAIRQQLPWSDDLDDARFGVLQNMAFNLGVSGLLQFHNMLSALQSQDWHGAAQEMMNSAWARQVGARATRLEQQMITGQWV